MAIQLHPHAVSYLRGLIDAGKVDASSAWSFDADDGNALLGKSGDDWSGYGEAFLGVDTDADIHTKAHYKYPVAKSGKVFLSGLRAAISRAGAQGADAIEAAARKLLDAAKPAEHAGFDDFIEVFAAGKHTDSQGNARSWSKDDLDQMVQNFNGAEPPPLVIGHPKTDSPAWGWTSELKRVGSKLLAKFNQVPEAVVAAVRDGRYRNRSVKVAQDDAGWHVVHVGLLGAAPPAIAGLAPIAFEAEPAGETYEFSYVDAAGTSVIGRAMQRLREFLIERFGADAADRVMPQGDLDQLGDVADAQRAKADSPKAETPQPAFARQSDEDRAMDEKMKADLDAAQKRAVEAESKLAEFAAHDRQASAQAMVEKLLAEGKLLPAQTAGLAEFLSSEPEAATFEFTAADAKVQKPRAEFLFSILDALPAQIDLNKQHVTGEVKVGDDPNAIVNAAREYQKAESAKGIDVPWYEAVTHVTHEG